MIKLVLIAVVAFAAAAPAEKEPVPILSQESEVDYTGKFHFSYESGDGSKVHEEGEVVAIDKDHGGESVKGEYEYLGDDGKTYKVSYVADENGFQPKGDHIPTPSPLIARALQHLATAVPPKDGKY